MSNNIIRLILHSGSSGSGFKDTLGNVHDLSAALARMGGAFGRTGSLIGNFLSNLAKGGIWGIAQAGISAIIGLWQRHNEKIEEARQRELELEETSRKSMGVITELMGKKIAALEKEAGLRKNLSDIYNRQYKAEMELSRAAALRAGDLAKVQALEVEIARANRSGAVDAAEAEAHLAEKRVEAAKRALDAAQKQRRDAFRREVEARKAAEAAKPRTADATVMQSSAGAFVSTRTVGSKAQYEAAIATAEAARDSVDAADEIVRKAKVAYDTEVEKWKIAKENSKAVAAEQKAEEEKEFAERLAAEKKAAAEANKAAKENYKNSVVAAKKKAAEDERRARQEHERLMLQEELSANTKRADDLRDKLKKAQEAAATAFAQFRDPSQIDQAGERRARRQEEIDRVKLAENAIRLKERNPDWRNARNLSNRDEATRRWLLAKEREDSAKADLSTVADKLDAIKTLLEAATQL